MDIAYFAETNARNTFTRFGIKQSDRLSHMYVIGKTGVGKSTLLETLARQDVEHGRGFCLIDPHGDLAERMKGLVENSERSFIYLDAAKPNQPYGYNPLRKVAADKIPLAVSGLLDAMKKLWSDAWGVRMEHVLRNSLYALIERDNFGNPARLRFLQYGDCQPMYDMFGPKPYLYYMVFGQPTPAYNIIHITSLGSDGIVGKSPVQLAAESVLMGINSRNTLSNFYEGNMKSKPAFLHEKTLSGASFERLKSQLQASWSKDKIMLLEDGLKVQEVSISPKDAEVITALNWSVEDIARIYRVPLHKLQSLGRSTNNNIEQQSIDFVTDTIVPNVERIEQQFKDKLFFDEEINYFVDMDVDYLLRGQSDKRASYYAQRFQVGSMTPNQIRQREGENPEADPQMNKYYLNGTYRPIDQAIANEQGNSGA